MANVRDKLYGGGGYRADRDMVDVVWDYSADGGAVGDFELFEATKPCVVHFEHAHVQTAVAGSGLSMEVGLNGAGNFAEVAVASLTLDSMHACTSFSDAYEVTTVTCVADSGGSLNNKYFLLNTPAGGTNYYVWMNVNSAGVDPAVAGRTGVEVALATNATDAQVATAVRAAVDALAAFSAPAPGANIVTVTNSVLGPVVNGSAGNSGFTVAVTTAGTINGVKGVLMADGDALTMSIRTAAATAGKVKFCFSVYSV